MRDLALAAGDGVSAARAMLFVGPLIRRYTSIIARRHVAANRQALGADQPVSLLAGAKQILVQAQDGVPTSAIDMLIISNGS